jgi:hypothetical protein
VKIVKASIANQSFAMEAPRGELGGTTELAQQDRHARDYAADAKRVALPAFLAGGVGGAFTALRNIGRVDPPTTIKRTVSSFGKAGSIFGLFTVVKMIMEEYSDSGALNSATAGAIAVSVPNLIVPSRTQMLQSMFSGQMGHRVTVPSVAMYSAVSGALLLGGGDYLLTAIIQRLE